MMRFLSIETMRLGKRMHEAVGEYFLEAGSSTALYSRAATLLAGIPEAEIGRPRRRVTDHEVSAIYESIIKSFGESTEDIRQHKERGWQPVVGIFDMAYILDDAIIEGLAVAHNKGKYNTYELVNGGMAIARQSGKQYGSSRRRPLQLEHPGLYAL